MSVSLASFNPLPHVQGIFEGFVPKGALNTQLAKSLPKQPFSVLNVLPHLANNDAWEKSAGACILNGLNHSMSPEMRLAAEAAQHLALKNGSEKLTYAAMLAGLATIAVTLLGSAGSAGAVLPAWTFVKGVGVTHAATSALFAAPFWVFKQAAFKFVAATRAAQAVVQGEKLAKVAESTLNRVV